MPRFPKLLLRCSGLISLVVILGACQHDQVASSGWKGPPEAQAVVIETIENAILARLTACTEGRNFDAGYVPLVKVSYNRDGTLEEAPTLLNPPQKDKDKSAAETAMHVARECDAMRDVKRYQLYYDSWHHYVLRFELARHEKGQDGSTSKKANTELRSKAL